MSQLIYPLLILAAVLALAIKGRNVSKHIWKFETYPENRSIRFFFILLICLSLINVLAKFEKSDLVYIPIQEKNFAAKFFHTDSVRPVIKNYDLLEIRGTPTLSAKNPGIELNLINSLSDKKNNLFDALLILVISIAAIIGLWNFDFRHPFEGDLSKTIFTMAIILLLFFPLEMIKTYILDRIIRNKTNNEYYYGNVFDNFNSVKLWIGAIFLRLSQILRNGEQLQKEQELTV